MGRQASSLHVLDRESEEVLIESGDAGMAECEVEFRTVPCRWILFEECDCHVLESVLGLDIKSGRHLDVGSKIW